MKSQTFERWWLSISTADSTYMGPAYKRSIRGHVSKMIAKPETARRQKRLLLLSRVSQMKLTFPLSQIHDAIKRIKRACAYRQSRSQIG